MGAPLVLAPDPSGRLLATGDLSGSLHLWDLHHGHHTEIEGYPDPVELLAWARTGNQLATVADDEITVWTISTSHDEVVVSEAPVVLQGHDEHITDIAFRPGGTLLASTGADATLALWDPVATDEPLGRFHLGMELSRCSWRPGHGTIAVGTATGNLGVVELWSTLHDLQRPR